MAGPPPAIGPLVFHALRATAYDLPEDFASRLEPGLDEGMRTSLETGIRVLRFIRRLWTWTLAFVLLGAVGVVVSAFFARAEFGGMLAVANLMLLGLGTAIFLYLSGLALAHRRDIRRVEAFAEAMRGSSLARDIG